MSIAAMEQTIENQPGDLKGFADQLRGSAIPKVDQATVFTGAGDSYAAALFAQQLTGARGVASDPYELSTRPELFRGKNLVLISVSGRTRANVDLANKAKGKAKRTIAITANTQSSLARICDDSVILQYTSTGLTPGTISFTASLLACAYLVDKLPRTLNLTPILDAARNWAGRVRLERGLSLFIGSGADRAGAEYGACKVQEVLGAKASAQFPEQVGHAQLFSLDPALDNIVCIDSAGSRKVRRLAQAMSRSGFRVSIVPPVSGNAVVKSLGAAFCLQYLVLMNAKRRRINQVAFLREKKRLDLSNLLIY